MRLTMAVLSVAGVPLLGGCMMMGGWGHAAGLMGPGLTRPGVSEQRTASWRHAEAASDGLTLTLAFPVPTGGDGVTISAWLRWDDDVPEPPDGEIWLRIQTPGGSVDRVRMQEPASPADGTYRAWYAFVMSGTYVVTADARSGTGADTRMVSVTAEMETGDVRWDGESGWVTPAALAGGLGMLALWAAMMGGVAH